jgi:homoserine kinase type II
MALLDGYESVRPLSRTRAALPLLARGSALRFMLTRLYDWLTTPPARWCQEATRSEYIRRCASTGDQDRPEYGLK